MGKPTTSANANVDFNIADLANTIASLTDNDRNDLAVVIENGTEFEFDINFRVDHGNYHSSHGSSILSALKFEDGTAPKVTNYEIGFVAAGAGCNATLTLTTGNRQYFIMAATPVNKENYFKFSQANDLDDKDKNYSGDGFKTFRDGNLQFELSITGSSPAVCTVYIKEV